MPTVADLGRQTKAKYPEYQDMDDVDLGRRIRAKYPEYSDFEDLPVGAEKTGLPGVPLTMGAEMKEVAAPSLPKAVADVTVGAFGGGALNTVAGMGGAMQAVEQLAPMSKLAKMGGALGRQLTKAETKPPQWVQELGDSPNRLTDPAFITNLAMEGAGSSITGSLLPGSMASRLPVAAFSKSAQWAAGTATGAFFESLTDAGNSYNEAIERYGASPEAAATVFTETMKRQVPTTMATSIAEFAPRAGGSFFKRALQVGLDAAMEGTEEVAQGVAQRSAMNKALGTNIPLMEGAAEEAIGGALGGGVVSGGRALAGRASGNARNPTSKNSLPVQPDALTGSGVGFETNQPENVSLSQSLRNMQAEAAPEVAEARQQVIAAQPEAFARGQREVAELQAGQQPMSPYEQGTAEDMAFWAGVEGGVTNIESSPLSGEPLTGSQVGFETDAGDPLTRFDSGFKMESDASSQRTEPAEAGGTAAPGAARALPAPSQAAATRSVEAEPEVTKPLHEMSPEELDSAIAEASSNDKALEERLFGVDGAKEYRRLQRLSNSATAPRAATDAAYERVTAMEDALSERQRHQLFGIGDDVFDIERAKEVRSALMDVDVARTPAELGQAIAKSLRNFNSNNPTDDPVAFAQLRRATQRAFDEGWNTSEVMASAIESTATRYADPEDAAMMLERSGVMGGRKQPQGSPAAPSQPLQEMQQLPAPTDWKQAGRDAAASGGTARDAWKAAAFTGKAMERMKAQAAFQAGFKEAAKPIGKQVSAKRREKQRGAIPLPSAVKTRAQAKQAIKAAEQSSVYSAAEAVVRSLHTRVSKAGEGAGAPLIRMIDRAKDFGDMNAGKAVSALAQGGMAKLSREERMEMMAAMEGRAAPKNAKVKAAADAARGVFDELAGSALGLGLEVRLANGRRRSFLARDNYFPHSFPKPEALQRGQVRRDVADNLVRLGEAGDVKEAEAAIDEYVDFMKSGKRQTRMMQRLVATGQAKDMADALRKLNAHRSNVRRYGSLEYAREIDLPFWDPDPMRVLPHAAAASAKRLAQVAEFGQNDERIHRHMLRIFEAGGNVEFAKAGVDRMLGRAIESDDAMTIASRLIRIPGIFKLGMASMANATQQLNILMASDTQTYFAVVSRAMISKAARAEMKGFALKSGAILDPILTESAMQDADSMLARAGDKFLKRVGFSAVERWNRIIAANVGRDMTRKLKARAMLGNKHAQRQLGDLGVDYKKALNEDSYLMAGKKMSDMTQFRSRPEDFPAWASSAAGKIFWQFKGFSYNQNKFMAKMVAGELRSGNWGRGMRNLFILMVAFPGAGEVLRWLTDTIMGREPKEFESLLERYLADVMRAGALGILADMTLAISGNRGVDWAVGPGIKWIEDTMGLARDVVSPDKDAQRAIIKYARRHAPLGNAIGSRLE